MKETNFRQELKKMKEKFPNIPYPFEKIDSIKVERTNKPEGISNQII